MNDLFWHFGTGYGSLYRENFWYGISNGFWNFYINPQPAFVFTNETNTGFYFPNGSEVKFK